MEIGKLQEQSVDDLRDMAQELDIAGSSSMKKQKVIFSIMHAEAEAKGLGAASFGGRMVDYAMVSMGEDLISRAETIATKQDKRLAERQQF